MLDGKKSIAFKVFYDALDILGEKVQDEEPLNVWSKSLENITPHVEVRSRRIGGATFQIPQPVREDRKISLATIYNTLKQFTTLGLIREIVVDQNKSLYCTNKESHYHLYIEDEDKVVDIPTKNVNLDIPQIPACLKLHNIDVIVRIRTLKESKSN